MAPYTVEEIKNIVSLIAREYGVESVSLFGSYARRSVFVGSNIDLKIEKGRL